MPANGLSPYRKMAAATIRNRFRSNCGLKAAESFLA